MWENCRDSDWTMERRFLDPGLDYCAYLADELEDGLELLQALPRGDGEDQDERVT
jgi:hypothetical protein